MLLSFASTATGTAMHESLDADSLAEDLLDDALLALLQDERPEPDRIAPRESAGPAPSPSPSSACGTCSSSTRRARRTTCHGHCH